MRPCKRDEQWGEMSEGRLGEMSEGGLGEMSEGRLSEGLPDLDTITPAQDSIAPP